MSNVYNEQINNKHPNLVAFSSQRKWSSFACRWRSNCPKDVSLCLKSIERYTLKQ